MVASPRQWIHQGTVIRVRMSQMSNQNLNLRCDSGLSDVFTSQVSLTEALSVLTLHAVFKEPTHQLVQGYNCCASVHVSRSLPHPSAKPEGWYAQPSNQDEPSFSRQKNDAKRNSTLFWLKGTACKTRSIHLCPAHSSTLHGHHTLFSSKTCLRHRAPNGWHVRHGVDRTYKEGHLLFNWGYHAKHAIHSRAIAQRRKRKQLH